MTALRLADAEPTVFAEPSAIAIEIRGARKRFGAVDVLRGVDVDIAAGRVTAVVGPNGAGKTTLIKSMVGLTHLDAGAIRIGGAPITEGDAYRERIGYMPQIARFPHGLTGVELLAMLRDLRGDGASGTLDETLIAEFELDAELAKPLHALSGGNRQKVNAAAAFLFSPEILLLDEPTAGLDPVASGVLKARIHDLRSAGRTVIVTSHILSDLQELSDDIIVLLDGIVRYAGAVEQLLAESRERSLERAIARLMRDSATAGRPSA